MPQLFKIETVNVKSYVIGVAKLEVSLIVAVTTTV